MQCDMYTVQVVKCIAYVTLSPSLPLSPLPLPPSLPSRPQSDFPEQFRYKTKAMFVFEEIDGSEVCFFGLHVQEYGSDCLGPNTRRVYISYLDSIHFFHPRHLRTLVYHEILIGYLQFCKNNG